MQGFFCIFTLSNKLNVMERKPTIVEQLLIELDGKKARVSSGSLFIQGALEGKVKLEWGNNLGLNILVDTKWNSANLCSKLGEKIKDLREENGLSYDQRDAVLSVINNFFDSEYVQAATIYPYNIVSYTTKVDDNSCVTHVNLVHKDGNTTEISVHTN